MPAREVPFITLSWVVPTQAQEALRTFRAALQKAGGQYLLGSFSYADILLAIIVQGLCPPGQPRKCALLDVARRGSLGHWKA